MNMNEDRDSRMAKKYDYSSPYGLCGLLFFNLSVANYTALWTVYHSVQIIEFKNLISPIEMNLIDWFVNRFNESDSFVYESAVCSVFSLHRNIETFGQIVCIYAFWSPPVLCKEETETYADSLTNSLGQGYPILFLEIYLPAEFSSNPDQNSPVCDYQVLLQILISWFSCFWLCWSWIQQEGSPPRTGLGTPALDSLNLFTKLVWMIHSNHTCLILELLLSLFYFSSPISIHLLLYSKLAQNSLPNLHSTENRMSLKWGWGSK